MSSLENTITDVMIEEAAKLPKASADVSPDADAEKKSSAAVKKAGEAVKPAKPTNKAGKGDNAEVVSDGTTKVEKGKAVNQEEVEAEEAPALEEMSKADLLKQAVASMKEMDATALRAAVAGLTEDDEDGDEDEKSESLSRNALIRKVVESLKSKSIAEVTSFIKGLSSEEEEDSDKEQKTESKDSKKSTSEMEDEDEDETDEEEKEESVKKESYDIDMTDDIEALVSDEDLSEEFKIKAKTIFEASVAAKVKELIAEKEAQLEEEQNQKIEEIKDDLSEKVDSYLNYVSESWVTENELAIERGLKSELTEDFINGLKKLFEEHYVEVPEDKFDVVEELAARLDDMEDKLNEEVASNISALQDIEELQREKIISEASKDLADSEIEKLKVLAEDVDFEDEGNFVEKVSTLKEAYFKGDKLEAVSDESNVAFNETDEENKENINVDPSMAGYTAAISKFSKIDS